MTEAPTDMKLSTQEPPARDKPYICCTMDREELQKAATAWLYYWIESAGSDYSIALKHHAEVLAQQGPEGGYVANYRDVMLNSLIDAALDGSCGLLAPLVNAYVIPHVDWRKAAIEATERYAAEQKAIRESIRADRQSAKVVTSTD